MAVATPLLTYEHYMAEGEINRRYDILDGVRRYMTNPSIRHQDILFNIAAVLKSYGKSSGKGRMILAPCDILIRRNPLRTRQPGVLYVSYERFGSRDAFDPAPLSPAPELAIEILSPSDSLSTLDAKLDDYRSVGVLDCWVVDPAAQTIEVLRLSSHEASSVATFGAGQSVQSITFADLTLRVADVFAL